MNLNYRNPTSPITSLGNVSAPLDVTYGTNYSVLSTGGYMEVYNLNDLDYIIPTGQTGLIEYSANTIPIQFNKGIGTIFSPDVLTLHSDNISSGRRKLGMLVYVYETKNIYQYTIDNYDALWTAATTSSGPGGPTVVISEFGTTIKNNSVAGQNFINAWTASTIEGISGYTNLNATWRIFKGSPFSGGTIPAPTTFTGGLTATTFSAGTYLGLPLDVYTTGSTLIGDTIFFDRNDLLSAYSVNLSAFTPSVDIYTTGATLINDTIYFDRNDLLSAYSVNLSAFTPSTDVYVTGFTYSSNTLTIFDNSGNTFSATINDFTGLTINGGLSATTISGGTFYGDGTNLTGINFTGGTVSGDTIFLSGITASTISASTYQNLPIDPDTYVTGFTYSANTFTISDNSGTTFDATFNDVTGLTVNGDFNVTGNTNINGLTATTISASTYQNLPTDFNTFVTGFTYSANTFTISDNSGNTFDATFNEVTGLTINGGLSATTISATTYYNFPEFTGNTSANCISDIYVSNIHSCSPLNINPLNEGNIYFGSTSAVTIDLSNNRVGIGTSTPNVRLQVKGIDNTSSNTSFLVETSGATPLFSVRNDGFASVYNASQQFGEKLSINGTVLVGTSGYLIQDGSSGYWQIFSSGNVFGIGKSALSSPILGIDVNNPYYIFTNSNYNFGIGISTPSAKLHINNVTTGYTFLAEDSTNPDSTPFTIDAAGNTFIGGLASNWDGFSKVDVDGSYLKIRQTSNALSVGDSGTYTGDWQYGAVGGRLQFVKSGIGPAFYLYSFGNSDGVTFGTYVPATNVFRVGGNTAWWLTQDQYTKVAIKSDNTGSSSYSLKVFNSSDQPMFVIKDNANVGVNILNPSEELEVSGRTKTTNFTMTSGATNGYVLTSDGSGNASWSPVSGASGYSDVYVTGFTYSANTFTISDNSGSTFNATINDVTGLTVNGTLSATTISANTIGNVQYIDFDTTQTGTTAAEGRLFWDVNNRTLSLGMIGGPVQQIGEEQYYLVENQTTGILNDGTVVRAAGTSGASGKILIDYMIANATIPAFTTLGVLTQPLNSGDTGYVTSFGLVRGLDTTGSLYGETWFDGTILYVSPTILGGFTSVKPINPNLDIIIGIVMKAGSGTTGSIFVRPDVYRPFKDPNRIIVAKQNGDFTTIKDALDTITASSSSNRYVIDVGPGEFYEPTLDLNNKPYVSIVGSNIQTTLIIPTGSTQHILNIGINNEISFLSFSGAGSGYAAIHCDNIGDFAQAHKCSFYDCDINIWVKSFSSDTKFYGEYLDFNGEYSYGVRCEATNGFLAFANLENCYNFPVGTGVTIANYATGSGATINTYVIDNISNGVSGSTAYWLQNDAMIHASAINSEGWTYGIYVPNTGGPPMFQFNGATFTDNQYDAYVDRTGTMGYYQGIADHTKIFTVSEDFYWVFLDSDDGELDVTRKISVTFTDGSHTDASTLIFEGSTMGLMSGGTISLVSATTINTQAGYGYLEVSSNIGIVRRIDWVDTTITLSANTENYIFINENGILSASGSIPNTFFNILMGRVVTNSTGVEFIEQSPQNANHTSNRFSTFNRTALGPVYATGSIVTEGTTPFTLDVSAGDYFFSENQFLPSGGTPITFTQYYRDGLGGWITSATTGVTNAYYDGNGSLSGLTGYTKHTLYIVGDGVDEKYFLVLGQNQYDTLVQTEGALLPTPPTYFDDAVTQIANIYVQSGTTGITQIEDIRPVIGFKAGGVNASSLHANLLGLSSDDHLQYLLVNGGRAMSGNLDMGGNNIVSAGTINGVTIESHAIRHQFGGSDQVGTTTPSANAIPYADVNGKLDSWISTATTSTLGLVTLSTSPVLASTPIVVGENDTRFQTSFTGASFNDSTDTLTLNRVNGTSLSVTGLTDYYVTGFSYDNANTITLSQNNGQSTGITLNIFTGITATTISATTYQNLPTDFNTFITAFTYNNNTFTINDNSGNTFNATFNSVTGLTVNGTLSATTISGGTFYGDGSNLSNVVNSLTTSTGLSANTTTGNITILNTAPDQVVTISGGTGILTGGTYPNFTITNTLPDQTVVLNNGTGISTSGTYPNFTITNTLPDQIVTLSGGTGITTGGTYPNFSITNSSPDQIVTISGGTGILTGGTYPNFEITNTAPDQLVTISGGTGITTGGTYPNFSITNSSPDQIVTISGGSGMSVTGTYPNFTIANTGETFVTGVTYSANTLTVSQNGGQSPINTTIGLRIKSGTVAAGSFTGTPRTAVVTFTTAYPTTSYSIGVTGSDNRTFTYTNKTVNGFTINSNANTPLTGNVDWQTIAYGES